ncbi:VCBS repeat-containing protein [Streptomyces sp. WAC08241]|uniref:FG-GAP repeat domain-containing protein n=1 Tax=Streptomyces sp. WAC08241 TaxID=2487421 RepID=UPI000F7AD392|nr:VCBS repeat-containing protein [Streptomyces sp. WAC08241]RSS44238.1 VCBS repeat-containing protein [Streptomyces sp. WAC08241]
MPTPKALRPTLAIALAVTAASGLALTTALPSYAAPQLVRAAALTDPVGEDVEFTPTVADPTNATAEELEAGARAAGLPAPETPDPDAPDTDPGGPGDDASATAAAAGAETRTAGTQALTASVADDSDVNGEITREEILARAQSWIDQQVPYSQTRYHSDRNGKYRQDCSGFVSMAWHLKASASNNYGATTWTLPNYAVRLGSLDDLRPGDMIDRIQSHVVLFKGWTDSSHTTAVVLEEAHSGTNARQSTRSRSYLLDNGFLPYRYKKVIEERVTTPSLNGDKAADLAVLDTAGNLAVRNNHDNGAYFDGGKVLSKGWANFLGQPGKGQLYFADANGDGRTDLFVQTSSGEVSVRRNLGAGKGFDGGKVVSKGWSNFTGQPGKGRLYFADANGDGDADLIVHDTNGDVAIRVNHGHGAYFDGGKVVSKGWANFLGGTGKGRLYFADANGDGRADLIVHDTAGDVAIRVNHDNGAYFDSGKVVSKGWANFLGGTGKGRLYFADTNGDNTADLIVHDTDGDVAIRVNHDNGAYFDSGKVVSRDWANFLGNDGQGDLYFG